MPFSTTKVVTKTKFQTLYIRKSNRIMKMLITIVDSVLITFSFNRKFAKSFANKNKKWFYVKNIRQNAMTVFE